MWWENHFLTASRNRLLLAGKEAVSIAAEKGTPLFVYGRKEILSRYRRLQEIFRKKTPLPLRVCYAMKANPHRAVLETLRKEGAWVDAVSPGEVEEALAAGFPAERILFTGTSVSWDDFHRVFRIPALTINIDALEQIPIMAEVRRNVCPDRRVRVSIRWNPGIGRGFNPKVVTAGKQTRDGTPVKFGVEESKVLLAFQKAREEGFQPVGLHQHLGSGWVKEDFPAVCSAVAKMVRKAAELERAGFPLEFLDFGGGFGPRYRESQSIFPLERYAAEICRQVRASGLSIRALLLEPGKYLIGEAGVLLLRVEYVKESYGNFFACVNGGTFNTVPRPAIYLQAFHAILNASCLSSRVKKRVTVAGNLCETGDVFGKNILMPLPKAGDILAVLGAGAYCRSMASHFNLRPIPPEILV